MTEPRSASSDPIRVLVVDDSLFMRTVIKDILRADSNIQIIGETSDGIHAEDKIAELQPDVVTLDLIMPILDGLATLKRIMRSPSPPAVLMVSAYTPEAADVTVACLAEGAVDIVLKPSQTEASTLNAVAQELRAKVKAAAAANMAHHPRHVPAPTVAEPPALVERPVARPSHRALVIGSSTGGPAALEELLPALPADFSATVLVAQHIPAQFVEPLAARLAKKCHLPVTVAREGDHPAAGVITFAPGGLDLTVAKDAAGQPTFAYQPSDDILTPSIDALMTSAAEVYGTQTTGVVLTGMGQDGLAGAEAVKQAGGTTIVQDEASSVVYGMGRAVAEHHLADSILPLDQIAQHLT